MSALPAIAVLAALIIVHELGHFMAARLQGIYANRFSIGFGPILWKYQGPETEYAIRAFPLGGFVGFPDDDPEENNIDPNDPNLLRNRPILDRAIVISAGVIANLIFAYLVLVLQVGTVGVLKAENPGVTIPRIVAEVSQVGPKAADLGFKPGDTISFDQTLDYVFNPQTSSADLIFKKTTNEPIQLPVERKKSDGKSELVRLSLPAGVGNDGLTIRLKPTPAIRYGLKPGDAILAANGQVFDRSIEEQATLRKIIQENPGTPIQLKIQRDEQVLSLVVTPEATPDGEGRIGTALAPNGKLERQRAAGFAVFSAAADEFQTIVNQTIDGFAQLISRFTSVADQVGGPVAIVAAGARITQSDAANLFYFAALISINLAVINILPLPALDGGHLAFLLIEGLRGKPLPTKIQDGVMQTGFMLLLGLGIFLIIRDTANLIPQ
ncbi:MAG: RIP metalloprotease RseP [Leptolyngbyaceae cyanobacterium RU_5_1]|nr:RIP metalloprotease RseP [Leptolyngbyaceae cyanobacterium RU_5_1]